MGTTALRVYEIKEFKGLNLHDEARKIAPGEFTSLINASTNNNSIKADAVDALINMPVPKTLINTIGDTGYEYPWLNDSVTANWGNPVAYLLSGNYAGGQYGSAYGNGIAVLVPMFTTGATASSSKSYCTILMRENISNEPWPSAQVGDGINYQNGIAKMGGTSSFLYDSQFRITWEAHPVFSCPSGIWIVFNGIVGSAGSGVDASNLTAKTYSSASGWQTTTTRWSCLICKYALDSGHVTNIIPIICQSEQKNLKAYYSSGSFSNNYTFPTAVRASADSYSFSRLRFNDDPIKSGFRTGLGISNLNHLVSGTGAIDSLIEYPDFNLIQNDKVVSLSSPENKNGKLIDYYNDGKPVYTYTGSHSKFKRKMQTCFFNGYLVYARNGKPLNAIMLNNDLRSTNETTTYVTLATPTFYNPRGVISYNNFLFFYSVINLSDDTLLKFRMYFSTAGMIDNFSANQYENLSDGEEILWIEEWYGSLIVFFSDRIKRYTGTPGNATLETIFYRGVSCAEVVCKTGRGIFFVSTDGLYLYNGTFNRITDMSTKFDQADSRKLTEDGWMEFNDKSQELYFYPGYDSVVNVWNAKNNIFRQKDYTTAVCSAGMRFFKYYHNMDLKTAISYPGITHVSQVEAGTTYQAITVQSGWIDVSEGENNSNYEQKRFDRAVIEFSGQTTGAATKQYSITGDATFGITLNITINSTVINEIWFADAIADRYTSLANAINACGEPVTATAIGGSMANGIYITANNLGVDFTLSLAFAPNLPLTMALALVTDNVTPTDYFNLIINFDDGTSVTANSIPLFSASNIVSYPVMLNKQAKLVQYKITCPAQTNQFVLHKIKIYYDDTMLR